MKCVKQTSSTSQNQPVRRVSDEKAERAVRNGAFRYATKAEWKKDGRIYS